MWLVDWLLLLLLMGLLMLWLMLLLQLLLLLLKCELLMQLCLLHFDAAEHARLRRGQLLRIGRVHSRDRLSRIDDAFLFFEHERVEVEEGGRHGRAEQLATGETAGQRVLLVLAM